MLIGAKGGGGSSFVQKPDNLRSEDTFEGLLGLCAGPIKGPVRGMKSIRVNGTPIEDEAGTANFKDFAAEFADGDPLKFPQIAKLKLGSAGAPDSINLQLRNTHSAGTPGDWITHTINNTGAEAIDLRFVVSQLYKQSKNGIFGNTLHIDVEMKPVGTTTWINPFAPNGNPTPAYNEDGYNNSGKSGNLRFFATKQLYDTSTSGSTGTNLSVTGKTTSAFVKELRVQVPNEGTYANKGWDIRVRLVEPETVDDDPNFEKRTVSWESATVVFTGELGDREEWRAFAWLQVYGKASDNFNGVPELDGIYDLKIVSVPPIAVFDPVTRTYSGAVWDGTWEKAWTQDPAWIINDAISDSISGLATFVPGAHLNKWDALELSKWASELVPDGAGGMHPRHSMNLLVDQPQKTDEFIRYLAGAVGATAWDNGGGEWRLKVDKPEAAVDIFTSETIEGEFVYSHTDVDTRYNDITIVFLNEEFEYREDRVRVVDQPDIDKNGRKPTRIVAIGITNRQQALRWAVLRLRTNINEFRAVNFTTNRRGKLLERFDQILIADGTLNLDGDGNLIRSTGRIIENKGGSIVLRDSIRLEVGVAYSLHVTVPNANYNPEPTTAPGENWQQPTLAITRTIMNTAGQRGDVTELFLDSPLPANVAENANIALEAVGLPAIPKVFRIVDISYGDDDERIIINAVEVDTGKWAAADNATDDNIDIVLADAPPPPTAPADGVLSVGVFPGEFDTGRVLYAHWDRPLYPYADGYRLERRHNNGPWIDLGRTRDEVFELVNPAYGLHEFRIYTLNVKGMKSLPLEASLDVEAILDSPLTGYLTNETHTVAAAADGSGFSLTDAGGEFVVMNAVGRVTTGITYEILSETGCDATINADGSYVINSLSADQATAIFRATVTGFAQPLEKTYTLTKSRGGVDGSDAKLLFVISNRQTIGYNADGTPNPASQTITFTAQKQNTAAVVSWTVTDQNGVTVDPSSVLSATSGDSVTMTVAQFAAACNGTNGVIVKGSLTDGATLTDQISVVKVKAGADGATGPGGPVIALNADDLTFDYIDGVPALSSQLITLVASKQNTSEMLDWSASPAVTLGAPDANTRTLSLANFGSNTQVTITATGASSGVKASVTIIRNDITTPNDSIIPDSNWRTGSIGVNRPWNSIGEMVAVNIV